MKKRVMAIALVSALAVGLLASTSMIVGAASVSGTETTSSGSAAGTSSCPVRDRGKYKAKGCMLRGDLSAAVADGIITSAESSGIATFLASYQPTGKTDLYAVLVEKNILTQDKADALKAYIEAQAAQKRAEMLNSKLGSLVTDGTITQAQADKIAAVLQTSSNSKSTNPLSALVSDGTLTQTQADAVWKTLRRQMGQGGQGGQKGRGCKGGRCISSSAASSGTNG